MRNGIGCAVNPDVLRSDAQYRSMVVRFSRATLYHMARTGPIGYWGTAENVLWAYQWALDQGMEVRGKAPFFARKIAHKHGGIPTDPREAWQLWLRHAENQVQHYPDVVYWEVAAEAWARPGKLRPTDWGSPTDWVADAFCHMAALTDKPLYYSDYNAKSLEHWAYILDQLQRYRQQGVRIDGIVMQVHTSISPFPVPRTIERTIERALSMGLAVDMAENTCWGYDGLGHGLPLPLVERVQKQAYARMLWIADKYSLPTSVWFPWDGEGAYPDSSGQIQQAALAGLWRQDWSAKPALEVVEPWLRP